ncbi:MAG: MFS transporter [Planctomycetaceae bacterium]|nr:MFS transporter [Planctomycetaceae bacterium]
MNNNRNLFLASFFTLIAAGVGFSIRANILDDWEARFGFTKSQSGELTGAGLVGFGFTIIICSLIADRVGYKALMVVAFLLHVGSALVTFAARPIFMALGGTGSAVAQDGAYWSLFIGALMFSLANGVCESVINPLVATLYPNQKTHYLNILHAGWPGGLIVGGVLALFFCGENAYISHLPWEIAVAFFLPPTIYYGYVILKEKFPISEAKAAGVSFGTMLTEFASPILLLLFVLHACVGYVELGTDGWIQNIMNASIGKGAVWLFIWTSGIMFALRFFAGPIVEHINPLGLLFISAVLGCLGLYGLGTVNGGLAILAAGTIYGIGKTFYWPTMLGVVGERYPKGGALTMGTIGGIGMLSAGILGGPGIGYFQDKYASENLKQAAPAVYEEYKADTSKDFLGLGRVSGLDGVKVGAIKKKEQEFEKDGAGEKVTDNEALVLYANLKGGKKALEVTSYVPAAMAVGYLILVIYFRAKGGYQVEVLHGHKPVGEHYTGGVEGPVEA